jgi:NitT/TauT family transport system substrate-binding protein
LHRALIAAAGLALLGSAATVNAAEIDIGIGTQNTTTNTVTTGIVIRQLHLLEKYLPTTGKYAGVTYHLDWQNFTSGPPVTNAMMADKLQFGAMGDYPLVVNGATFAKNPDSRSELIGMAAYNLAGSGNGVVVNVKSPYYSLADLKGKVVSVPFGSAAHGMLLKAMQDAGWPTDYFHITNQSPEVGSTNLQEQKIDAHTDFVPFVQLLPFRGFARAVFDGVETHTPTWHGIVVRSDFADKYPEIVVAYLRAVIAADAWVRANPQKAAEQIAEWTGTDKEVVYIFLGPGGIMTLDPTIKPQLLASAQGAVGVLHGLGRLDNFDVKGWANDTYIRAAYKQAGLDYDAALASTSNYAVSGEDTFCHRSVTDPASAGEVWVDKEPIHPAASPSCALAATTKFRADGKTVLATYVFDAGNGVKLFADKAFYAIGPAGKDRVVAPYLLRAAAEARAKQIGGTVADFAGATSVVEKGE